MQTLIYVIHSDNDRSASNWCLQKILFKKEKKKIQVVQMVRMKTVVKLFVLTNIKVWCWNSLWLSKSLRYMYCLRHLLNRRSLGLQDTDYLVYLAINSW